MSTEITLTIKGRFDEDELGLLVRVLRAFDDSDPGRRLEFFIDGPETTVAEAQAIMGRLLPPAPGRRTEISTHRISPIYARGATGP